MEMEAALMYSSMKSRSDTPSMEFWLISEKPSSRATRDRSRG